MEPEAEYSPDALNAILTGAFAVKADQRREPDLLLVFRNVSPENRASILEKFSAETSKVIPAPWEDFVAIHAFPERITSAQTMAQIGLRNGLSYEFNSFPNGNFGQYRPEGGGFPLKTRHVLIVTGPKEP